MREMKGGVDEVNLEYRMIGMEYKLMLPLLMLVLGVDAVNPLGMSRNRRMPWL